MREYGPGDDLSGQRLSLNEDTVFDRTPLANADITTNGHLAEFRACGDATTIVDGRHLWAGE